ncbi:hypothetical protein GGU10DRAFT_382816 [Lentinula aff. detonsa]|uniref:VanZ-like domain-containing protein n=1 Tax=Lentinula aff. detonsa TaxID=2804958 RepID=A0AA38NU90_9AGAR|nr:hypothetical protein GGU10DRAFT_382816 [Lentinula aff. detonsa]
MPPSAMAEKRKLIHRITKTIMKSHRMRMPNHYDLPIRLRPWFIFFTVVIMLCLAILGFTNVSHYLPLNDKFLHFICFLIATTVFYFVFDVDEEYRRIWFWRHSGLIITGFLCVFCGGILSEFVQSMLPYKEFQMGDIIANLLGSSIGLYVAYYMERYYRHRREISRLYRPLDMDTLSDDEDDDAAGAQLLPTHNSQQRKGPNTNKSVRLTDVWDEREELFGVGEDSDADDDDEGDDLNKHASTHHHHSLPKITVTASGS